ncbi:MAG: hypothetical protein PHG97_05855 [Candidatus Margulisbacteria bacterium]|nr:hypothetical protein [Candidatus Margulisiibacteriota bacterium]
MSKIGDSQPPARSKPLTGAAVIFKNNLQLLAGLGVNFSPDFVRAINSPQHILGKFMRAVDLSKQLKPDPGKKVEVAALVIGLSASFRQFVCPAQPTIDILAKLDQGRVYLVYEKRRQLRPPKPSPSPGALAVMVMLHTKREALIESMALDNDSEVRRSYYRSEARECEEARLLARAGRLQEVAARLKLAEQNARQIERAGNPDEEIRLKVEVEACESIADLLMGDELSPGRISLDHKALCSLMQKDRLLAAAYLNKCICLMSANKLPNNLVEELTCDLYDLAGQISDPVEVSIVKQFLIDSAIAGRHSDVTDTIMNALSATRRIEDPVKRCFELLNIASVMDKIGSEKAADILKIEVGTVMATYDQPRNDISRSEEDLVDFAASVVLLAKFEAQEKKYSEAEAELEVLVDGPEGSNYLDSIGDPAKRARVVRDLVEILVEIGLFEAAGRLIDCTYDSWH